MNNELKIHVVIQKNEQKIKNYIDKNRKIFENSYIYILEKSCF